LEDDEMAVVTRKGVRLLTLAGRPVERAVTRITWDPIMAEKGGYRHFMLKEIYEQPRAITDTFRGRIAPETGDCYLPDLNLTALHLLALHLGRVRGRVSAADGRARLQELLELPRLVEATLAREEEVAELARRLSHHRDFLYLGRGLHYPVALEGALKLKELSYIHAEGHAGGEMKHGPIALIDETMPVVAVMPGGPSYDRMLANIEEVKARDGLLIALGVEG